MRPQGKLFYYIQKKTLFVTQKMASFAMEMINFVLNIFTSIRIPFFYIHSVRQCAYMCVDWIKSKSWAGSDEWKQERKMKSFKASPIAVEKEKREKEKIGNGFKVVMALFECQSLGKF